PRKSRRKSACFSRTTTSTPARANNSPSIIPAGPPPAMQHRTDIASSAMRAPDSVSEVALAGCHHVSCRRRQHVPPGGTTMGGSERADRHRIARLFVELAGRQISYRAAGDPAAAPAIVLVHGSGVRARYWVNQLRDLRATARVVVLPTTDDSERSARREDHGSDPTGNAGHRPHPHHVREPGPTDSARALPAPQRSHPALTAPPRRG